MLMLYLNFKETSEQHLASFNEFLEIASFNFLDSDSLHLGFGMDLSEVQADNTLGNDSKKKKSKDG